MDLPRLWGSRWGPNDYRGLNLQAPRQGMQGRAGRHYAKLQRWRRLADRMRALPDPDPEPLPVEAPYKADKRRGPRLPGNTNRRSSSKIAATGRSG